MTNENQEERRDAGWRAIGETKELVTRLDQTIQEQLLPLIKKHDKTLYNEDGRGGIVQEVEEQKSKNKLIKAKIDLHLKNHYWAIGTIISIFFGTFVLLKHFLHLKGG